MYVYTKCSSFYVNSFIDTTTSEPSASQSCTCTSQSSASESGQLRWYFELHINELLEPSHSSTSAVPPSPSSATLRPHLRVGWADFQLFSPHPLSNGQRTTSGGIGDDFASVGFDGEQVWFGGHAFRSSSSRKYGRLRKQVQHIVCCQLTYHCF